MDLERIGYREFKRICRKEYCRREDLRDIPEGTQEALGMSIRGLAAELKVSAAYISDIEKGNRYAPSQEKLERLIEVLQIPEEDRVAFNDLASATHGFSYEDINPYLGREPHARVALRKAEKMGLSDSFWISVIEQMDQAEAEQLKALEEDSEMPD